MMQASWNGTVLAESDDTVRVEGNHYFPIDALRREYLRDSATHSVCPWKGAASYFDVVVDGRVNGDAVCYYPDPKPGAEAVVGRVAFWKGVKVTDTGDGSPGGRQPRAATLLGRLRGR